MLNTDVKIVETARGQAPDDDATTIGGAATTNLVDGTLYELLAQVAPNASGGGDKYRYFKFAVKNSHSSESTPPLVCALRDLDLPAGCELALGVEATANQETIQGTAPAGVVFTVQTGLLDAAVTVGVIATGAAKGVWGRIKVPEATVLARVYAQILVTQDLT